MFMITPDHSFSEKELNIVFFFDYPFLFQLATGSLFKGYIFKCAL